MFRVFCVHRRPLTPTLAERLLAGDPRAIARAISLIEDEDPSAADLVRAIFGRTGQAYLIGVTGPPGAGKSTLVDRLVTALRSGSDRDLTPTVGVIAVDPTSPFTGGAVLGDRLRMQTHVSDAGVFIRSMSARGALGGLARAAADTIAILNAMGCDIVIVETVGVGQNEVDIVRHAGTVVLVDSPNSGDAVQVVKAGIMEIGDIYVVNRNDQAGAARRMQQISEMLTHANPRGGWSPPVIGTCALTGQGIAELRAALDQHGAHSLENSLTLKRTSM